MRNFKDKLKWGQVAESEIALWLKSRGNTIIPIYEKVIDNGKGPQVFTPNEELVAPDILVFKGASFLWCEVKKKSAFSWHRKTSKFVTGIDLRHYKEYIKVMEHFKLEVYLFFLQLDGIAKDTPINEKTPSGLFFGKLSELIEKENHRSDKWAKGMVYWDEKILKKLCGLNEFYTIVKTTKLANKMSVNNMDLVGKQPNNYQTHKMPENFK